MTLSRRRMHLCLSTAVLLSFRVGQGDDEQPGPLDIDGGGWLTMQVGIAEMLIQTKVADAFHHEGI